MSALGCTSSIRRLFQRLKSKKNASEVPASPPPVVDESRQQQQSLDAAHGKRYSHFLDLGKGANQMESSAVSDEAQQSAANGWDISDESFDDDAVELDIDDILIAGSHSELTDSRSLHQTEPVDCC